MIALLLLVPALPLALVALLALGGRRPALALAPLAALPALVLAGLPGGVVELPWLLLGTRLAVDGVAAPLLLLAGIEWTLAGLYARAYLADDPVRDHPVRDHPVRDHPVRDHPVRDHPVRDHPVRDHPVRDRFWVFWLLTLAGNLGVLVAADAVGFYLAFALLTFAAYGLIAHRGDPLAWRAARVYMTLAVLGEALLLTALLLMVFALGQNPPLEGLAPRLAGLAERDWIVALTLAGFGIKMGVVPLHVWLALAHPVAPTPASAVLSGIIIKAGLVGWLRFLPLGGAALPDWGLLCIGVGLVSAFYGVLAGLPQARPKTVLAYSSISQMGLVTTLIGIGLMAPGAWSMLLPMVLLFALHHGLAKSALFLGVGVTEQAGRWAGWLLAAPALALAGAPFTSGALAKGLLKEAAHALPPFMGASLALVYTASSVATALLVWRFLYLAWPRDRSGVQAGRLLPWLVLVLLGMALPWWWAMGRFPEQVAKALESKALLAALWPVLGAGLAAFLAWELPRLTGYRPRLPEGERPQALLRLGSGVLVWPPLTGPAAVPNPPPGRPPWWRRWLSRIESRAARLDIAGLWYLLLVLLLIVLLGQALPGP